MSNVIVVDKVSKKFELGELKHETMLREQLSRLVRTGLSRKPRERDILWALKDVSFKVAEGELVGIVGRNGAGKSTLLKILSKITFPTSGRVLLTGRVASLLEVGTGFHEELTGRENVFLNGSILGMKSKEVESKMDAIVSFAGVERFLDTPIKRYSSGMRLRLGFAVAAHLDPEVLIVDEVLAVGDASFQKKCIGAMEELRGGGRTVLFVSHNMAAVENLCTRCIWIDSGKVVEDGPTYQVIKSYMGTLASSAQSATDLTNVGSRRGTGEIRYTKVEILTREGDAKSITRSGDSLVIRMHYVAQQPISYASFGFRMHTDLGTMVTETSTWHNGIVIPLVPAGTGYVDIQIELLNLLAGRYYVTPAISGAGSHLYEWIDNGLQVDVETANVYNSSVTIDSRYGIVFFPQRWNLHDLKSE